MIPEFGDCKEVESKTYPLLLYGLAESAQARRILEVGMGWGFSGRAFAESLRMRQPATLISIDPHPGRIRDDNAKAIMETGIDWEILAKPSGEVSPEGPFDILYIDGDPTQARADFERFYGLVRAGGYVVLDGYGGQPGPTDAVDALHPIYPFVPLKYHRVYHLAVHHKPLPKPGSGRFTANCTECNEAALAAHWSEIDGWADRHAIEAKHEVCVYAGPRGLKYLKGPR